jgi:hypothetical protein
MGARSAKDTLVMLKPHERVQVKAPSSWILTEADAMVSDGCAVARSVVVPLNFSEGHRSLAPALFEDGLDRLAE